MAMVICYHGTKPRNVAGIMRDGFREGTYFARHLEDAIHMGGRHVFGVAFDKDKFSRALSNWQFILREVVPPSRIVHHRVYRVRPIMLNDELQEEVLQSNLVMGQDYCDLDN